MTTTRQLTVRAFRTLALDAATAKAVTAIERQGVRCLLLKGPAIVAHLYADDPSERGYLDMDLLVPQSRFDEAGGVLGDLGYTRVDSSNPTDHMESARREQMWVLKGAPDVICDLHRGFHGVRNQEAFFAALWVDAVTCHVGGADISIPSRSGCALVVALHAFSVDFSQRALKDLDRALKRFDDSDWARAATAADDCGAHSAFVVGLSKAEAGVALLERLGIPKAAPPAAWLKAEHIPEGTRLLTEVLVTPAWRDRLSLIPRLAFPKKEFMRVWAERHQVGDPPHPPGLGSAYAMRLFRGANGLPATVRIWRSSLRSAADSGWSGGVPGATRTRLARERFARIGLRALRCVPVVLWGFRAWRRVHRELPKSGLEATMPTGNPPLSRSLRDSEGEEALKALLSRSGASCLEEAIVRQAWLGGRGSPRDLVVGVTAPSEGFRAHAWLEGDAGCSDYTELIRKPFEGTLRPADR